MLPAHTHTRINSNSAGADSNNIEKKKDSVMSSTYTCAVMMEKFKGADEGWSMLCASTRTVRVGVWFLFP